MTEERPAKRPRRPEAPAFAVSAHSHIGRRRELEDEHVNVTPAAFFARFPTLTHRLQLVAVFDGHGGTTSARYAKQHLPFAIAEALLPALSAPKLSGARIKQGIVAGFRRVDAEIAALGDGCTDGCCAVCVLFVDERFGFIANLGDSRAVLCRRSKEGATPSSAADDAAPSPRSIEQPPHQAANGVGATADDRALASALARRGAPPPAAVLQLTKDQKPGLLEERRRIEGAGGRVAPDGRVNGQLGVARSLGDTRFKRFGVSCVPDVTVHFKVDAERDECLLLASQHTAPLTVAALRRFNPLSITFSSARFALENRRRKADDSVSLSVFVASLREEKARVAWNECRASGAQTPGWVRGLMWAQTPGSFITPEVRRRPRRPATGSGRGSQPRLRRATSASGCGATRNSLKAPTLRARIRCLWSGSGARRERCDRLWRMQCIGGGARTTAARC